MEFPVYRKYPNNLSYFRIKSHEEFDELKLTGRNVELHRFKAKIHPDRVFIQDMINREGGFWSNSNLDEWEEQYSKVK